MVQNIDHTELEEEATKTQLDSPSEHARLHTLGNPIKVHDLTNSCHYFSL